MSVRYVSGENGLKIKLRDELAAGLDSPRARMEYPQGAIDIRQIDDPFDHQRMVFQFDTRQRDFLDRGRVRHVKVGSVVGDRDGAVCRQKKSVGKSKRVVGASQIVESKT